VPFQHKRSRPRFACPRGAHLTHTKKFSTRYQAQILSFAIAAAMSSFASASESVDTTKAKQDVALTASAQPLTVPVTSATASVTLAAQDTIGSTTVEAAEQKKLLAATPPTKAELGQTSEPSKHASPIGMTTSALPVSSPTLQVGAAVSPSAVPTPAIQPGAANVATDVNSGVVTSVDSTASVATEAPPTDLWDRIRAGYAMEDLDEDLVRKWEKFYADRPDYVARIVERSSKYMFYIVTELERRNMPLEIALLPMIESAFNPIAHSTAKASGIWQFIPSTGTAFGMKQDWWADSRRDIVAATNGALDYLTKLYGMFGDWQLALASYNWGEGAVMRAQARSKRAGSDGTYLTLNMPAETRNYLPKLQAVKNIVRDPAQFGLTLASIPNEPYFKTITLAHAIDLKKAAHLAGMTEAEFVALNPAHNRPVIAGRGEFQILLPADRAEQFITRLEAYEQPRVSWMAYKTRAGDRIDTLAQRFGTTVAALRSVNGIRSHASALPAGYNLLVPSDGPSSDALGSIQNAVFTSFPEQAGGGRIHRVRKGESLGTIARRYGVATATLAKWNRLGKSNVRAGQMLYINGPAPVRASGKSVRSQGKLVKASKKASAAKKKAVAKKPQRRN
jgi:membrane-bound lytic murein transglycosylase D